MSHAEPVPRLAEYLRREMETGRLNQSEFARKLGVYPDYVRRWLRGDRPRPEHCAQIADALGLRRTEVLQLAGYPVDDAQGVEPDLLTAEQSAAVQAMTTFVRNTPPEMLPQAVDVAELGFRMVWRAASLMVKLNAEGGGNILERMKSTHDVREETGRLEPAM